LRKIQSISLYAKPVVEFDSLILTDKGDKAFVKESILDGKTPKVIYTGSVNGFNAANYHQLCDQKKDLVTLIQSESGRIFGGYRSVPTTNNSGWVKDC
jgi:hypothetical protein